MIQLAIMNESTVVTDTAVEAMLPALAQQWNTDLAAAWAVESVAMTSVQRGTQPPAGAWWLVFLDDSDQAQALAYHDLTAEGLPIAKVFVKTIAADGSSLSVGTSHELCEMAVDPWLNAAFQDLQGTFWAAEVCDPVEDDSYGYTIDGVLVSDFVLPAWFDPSPSVKGPLHHGGLAMAAFAVLDGGYAQKFTATGQWQQVNGAQVRASRLNEAPYGSRRERRDRFSHEWKLSTRR